MKDFSTLDWSAFATCYPVLDPRIDLHRSAIGGSIVYGVDDGTEGLERIGYQIIETEGFMIEYLSLCDGTARQGDIVAAMSRRINPLMGPALAERALRASVEAGFITLSPAEVDRAPLRLTGSERSFQPQHLCLEIIETCNFSCDHCYYSSSPFKKGRLSLDDAVRIMDTARASGVRVIEITGGECTIHPEFREILAHACKNFDLVAMISNGYKLGNDSALADYVGGFGNLMVQISIDGLADHHDRFRKHRKSFEACERAVQRLVAAGRKVRIAMTVTDENLDDIVPMFRNAKAWGALQVVFSPVASIGRGCNLSDPGAGSRALVGEITRRLAPFTGDPILGASAATPASARYQESTNCGAGWRTFAVDYDGNVRACNYSRDSKKFGNLLEDGFESVFSQKANYLFRNAPSPGGKECGECSYYFNCKGCFVKAFMVSETVYPDCPWRAKWFPDMPLALEPDRAPVLSAADGLRGLPVGDKAQLSACASCGTIGGGCH